MTFRRLFGHHRVRRYGMRLVVLVLAAGVVAAVIAWLSGGGSVQEPTPTAVPTLLPGAATATLPAPATATQAAALSTAGPGGFVAAPDLRPDPARLEPAIVLDIVDGDTIDVRARNGEERVRFYGVDTTERGEDCFNEASDRTEELAGARVLLLPDARERDRYGRLLRYVFTQDGRSIDALLIAEGLGHAWRQDGAYRDQLVALEGRASAAGVGCLW